MQDAIQPEEQRAVPLGSLPDLVESQPTLGALVRSGAPSVLVPHLTIRYEWIVCVLLFLFALAIRFAELDSVPMSQGEAHQALAAYQAIYPNTLEQSEGEALIARSPLLFAAQRLTFSTLGKDEGAARMATALAGAVLAFTPLLFTASLGRGRTFAFVLLLVGSPVLLLASRESSPTVWAALASVGLLWGLWRFRRARRSEDANGGVAYGIFAIVMGGVLVFLSEPTGALWLLLIGFAGAVSAYFSHEPDAAQNFDFAADDDALPQRERLSDLLRALPWGIGLAAALLVVVAIATTLLIDPAGLTGVGELLNSLVRGFTQANPDLTTPILAYPFLVALFYEPFTLAFALICFVLLWRRNQVRAADRFFAAWLLGAFLLCLLYPGLRAAHGLWFTLPAAGLASSLAVRLFSALNRPGDWYIPAYSRWVLAIIVIMLLAAFSIAFQSITRSMVEAPQGDMARATFDAPMFVLLAVSALFILISTFMAGTVWNARAAFQGLGLGVLVFGLFTSLSAGWNGAVTQADNPAEFYHMARVTHRDTALLRQTLLDVADRQSSGFTEMPLAAVTGQDGPAAWIIRDFTRTRFAQDYSAVQGAPVILGANGSMPADLGAAYLGQDFTLSESWSPETMLPGDVLGWWSHRAVRTTLTVIDNVDLWLRQDIYDGTLTQGVQG